MGPRRRPTLAAAALLLLCACASPACAQSQEVEALRREIEALRLQQTQMAEEIKRLQSALGMRAAALSLGDAPSRGNPKAPLVLVEFSDYECPFCIRHFVETMPALDRDYIATGKMRYVFMDFPIDELHPAALKAHEAARCAGEQGKFWELHNRLFSPAGTHRPDQLKNLASEVGVDRGRFDACLDDGRMQAPVRTSVRKAVDLGANGTPQMYLGVTDEAGNFKIIRSIRGAVPLAQFKQVIDELLSAPAAGR